MAKLLVFAPCERVIVGQEDQSVSLISLLTGLTASLPFPVDQPIPDNATLPMRWYFLSVWRCEPSDIGSEFYQRTILRSPSGRELVSVDMKFSPTDPEQPILRGVVHLLSFPMTEFGIHTAILLVRPSEADEWHQISDYPIQVVRGPVLDLKHPPIANPSMR